MGIGTEDPVDMPMAPFTEQVQIIIGDLWAKIIGIICAVVMTGTVNPVQTIITRQFLICTCPFEQIGVTDTLELRSVLAQAHFTAMRTENPDGLFLTNGMVAQHFKWIMVAGIQNML